MTTVIDFHVTHTYMNMHITKTKTLEDADLGLETQEQYRGHTVLFPAQDTLWMHCLET